MRLETVEAKSEGRARLPRVVDAGRWRAAQRGEAAYWEHARRSLREQARILAEKMVALDQAIAAVPALLECHGKKVEVGIGPLGIGMLHFLSTEGGLIGVDPLPAVPQAIHLPRPMEALVAECRRNYTHIEGRGEKLPVETASTAIVASYNVLDHVESPAAVLSECFRVLRPGGYFILGCDTVSIASLAKFHAYAKWRHRDTLAVLCHPFRFRAAQLERLIEAAGFRILWAQRRRHERWERLAGHAFRLLVVAQKPAGAEKECTPIRAARAPFNASQGIGQRAQERVLLAHPGGQHSERLATELDRAGLLQRFVTGVRFSEAGALAAAMRLLPAARAEKWRRRCARRSFPEIPAERILTRPIAEAAYLAATRFPIVRRHAERLVDWRNLIFDRSVARSLGRERPDAVICFDTCALEAFRAARRLGSQTILDVSIAPLAAVRECYLREAWLWPEFADSMRSDLSPARLAREARELHLADCVLAPSAFVRRAVEDLGVAPDKIADVPFGVDLEKFAPGPRKAETTFRVLFVGKLTQRKGIAQLLEAFRRLRLPAARLEIVGDLVGSGRWLPRYRGLFDWYPNVTHAELAERYRRADVFVLPSLHEGSALVTYEALASGLPVIATPQTGSVVRDGVEGFLVPAGQIEPLAERLLQLFRDSGLRLEMGARARRRAEEFSWAVYGERLGAAVRRALGRADGHERAAAHEAVRGERTDSGGAIATQP
jgi:glycosyltransferase involved in cell wall biosynthesis/SAM-dependent methyltransferase